MPLLYHKTVYDVLTLPVYYLTTLYILSSRIFVIMQNGNLHFRREQAPALRCAVPLRIVGSGFCPISRSGRPRAMLAPDESVGKVENLFYRGETIFSFRIPLSNQTVILVKNLFAKSLTSRFTFRPKCAII